MVLVVTLLVISRFLIPLVKINSYKINQGLPNNPTLKTEDPPKKPCRSRGVFCGLPLRLPFPTNQHQASGVICTEGINSRICSPADQCPNISQERMAVVQAITSWVNKKNNKFPFLHLWPNKIWYQHEKKFFFDLLFWSFNASPTSP